MKAIKYFVMGALMIGFSTQSMAQDGTKADIDAVKRIISSKPADLDKQVKPFYKKNKKNAEMLVAFGRAFYEAKDTAHAHEFANYALEASKNKYAPAYLLLGDIAALGDDGGAAAAQYDQAIYADPKLADAYYKYALVYRKIDPRGAAQKLDQLKANCPEVSVEAIKAHIYMIAAENASDRKSVTENRKMAYDLYKQADITKLDKGNLNEFARASYFTGHFEDAVRVSEAGLKLDPRNPTFNRLAMFASYDMKNYDVAKSYISKYFALTDSVTFSEYDYYYAALIHEALNEKQEAYEDYGKALKVVSDSSAVKRWDILKKLGESYLADKNYDQAIACWQEYLACKPELKVDDDEKLADIYADYAEATPAKKEEYTKKAADIFSKIAEKYPIQEAYATFKRAGLIHSLDKNMEKSLAKPDYQKVVSLLANKADRSKSENAMLKSSYHYLMFNAYINKDVAGAKDYAAKILAIDPEYKPALDIQGLK